MENMNKSNWKLGAFVAVGLAILILFIFYIGKNKNIFSSTITLVSLFDDVSGLAEGNNVRLAGIKVGTVTGIEIVNDSLVKVFAIVEKDAQKFIRADSKMSIGSDGLMGDKVINIIKGSPDTMLVKDGALLASVKPFDSAKLLASLQKTASNAEVISGEFAKISRQLNSSKGAIGRLLNDSAFAIHMDRTVRHLEHASSGLSDNMEAAKHSFLLKGYFKKKEKEREKKTEEAAENKEDSLDTKEKKKDKKRNRDKE